MNKTLTALLSLALLPVAASAFSVEAPFPGTVIATTYSSSGAFHGAVDLSSYSCGKWGVETAVKASLFWNVTIRGAERACYGSIGTNSNEVKHIFANGYTFRQWAFIKTDASTDKTCNRCLIGDDGYLIGGSPGPPHHIQYDKAGTNSTAWYSGTTKGEFLDRGEVVGSVG